jgi:RNA polymerase sigma-70 factor (ECF subfamily)
MDESEIAALVQRALAGERTAFDILVVQLQPQLAARVQARIPADLRPVISADDVLQDAFVDAYRSIGAFEARGARAFEAWVGRIAENRLLDAIKAQRAAKRGGDRLLRPQGTANDDALIDLLNAAAGAERTPSRQLASDEAVAAIRTSLAELKPEYREALRLRFIEGRPMADVARLMEKTEPAVQKLCRRGLDALRETLGTTTRFFTRK